MTIFCDKTGVRLIPPTGDERADVAAHAAAANQRLVDAVAALAAAPPDANRDELEQAVARAQLLSRPVSADVDAEHGWPTAPPPPAPKPPQVRPAEPTAAPSVERAQQPAAQAAYKAPHRGR